MTTFFDELGLLNSLLLLSGAAFALIVLFLAIRSRRPLLILVTCVGVAIGAWIVYVVSPAGTVTRGDETNGITLIISYVAMVLGMMAHYVYAQAEKGAKKLKFRWLPFLMPVLASPIVFIPLVSIAGEVPAVGGAFTHAKLMVYLVAFQNGFFWKHFFDGYQSKSTLPSSDREIRSS